MKRDMELIKKIMISIEKNLLLVQLKITKKNKYYITQNYYLTADLSKVNTTMSCQQLKLVL